MAIFKKKQSENRSLAYDSLIQSLNTNRIIINKQSILKIPVVKESISKIASTIASLPLEMIVKDKFNNSIIENDERLYLLNGEANNYQTSYTYKYRIVEDLLIYGKHYSYIQRQGIKIKSLHPINFETVTETNTIDEAGIIVDKDISYSLNNTLQKRNFYEVLCIDTGEHGILSSTNLLELLFSHEDLLKSAITNASYPSGYLKTDGRLTQNTINKMRESWNRNYSGSRNAMRTLILEEGLDYKPLEVNLGNVQALESKQSFISDIQRLFNLHDINSDSQYLKQCISPLVSCIESALTCQLLLTSEKESNTKFIFDCEMVDRADEKTRIESISLGLDKGIYSINEARQKLDMNSFILDSEEEFLSISQGKIMLLKDGKVVVPNMGTSLNIDDEAVKPEGENNNAADL